MFGRPISLKLRITAAMLTVVVLALSALGWFGTRSLRLDMETALGNQQFATASYIAAEIENSVSARIAALELIAAAIPPKLLERPSALQDFLDQRFVLHQQFNGGVMITGGGALSSRRRRNRSSGSVMISATAIILPQPCEESRRSAVRCWGVRSRPR